MSDELPPFARPITMPGMMTTMSLAEVLGLSEADLAEMQERVNRECEQIRESERRAWISAQYCWID